MLMTLLLPIFAVLVGFVVLMWSADRFVDGASNIARNIGVSPLIIGMLVVGFGTSAPEMLVSGAAALQGNPQMGIGNGIGSNITNISLVLGVTALMFVLPVQSTLLRKEIPLVLAAGVLAYALMFDGYFSFNDGVILAIAMVIVLIWMIVSAKREQQNSKALSAKEEAEKFDLPDELPQSKAILWLVVGLVLLLISSKLLVWGASSIATSLGISDLIIGLTIVAIGTSLPELAASIASARKGETDLAVGNIVGSNLFNTLGVLAIPALIHPTKVAQAVLERDFPIMFGLTVLLIFFSLGLFSKNKYQITLWNGVLLLAAFVAYQILLYISATNLS